ncbi:MAG: hypothetical protein ACRC4N_12735, partial [Gammaproteobacteria bacterium]
MAPLQPRHFINSVSIINSVSFDQTTSAKAGWRARPPRASAKKGNRAAIQGCEWNNGTNGYFYPQFISA